MWGSRSRLFVAACPTLLALGVSGCVVTATVPPPRGILVSGPPPAVVYEEHAAAPPAPHAAWVPGYWNWTGIQYTWIPGHWEVEPPLGRTWKAPAYVQKNGAYFYEPGSWSTVPAHTQPPPSVAAFH